MSARHMCLRFPFQKTRMCWRYLLSDNGTMFNEIASNLNSLHTKRFVYDATKEYLNAIFLSQTSGRSMVTSNAFYTDNLMLLSNRSFSQDFTHQCQPANESFILGMNMSINPTNEIIGNSDNAANESKLSNWFLMGIMCLKKHFFLNTDNRCKHVLDY